MVRDALTHPYFAGHGYACLRVDMRGNGESDGVMLDEYALQEQEDALAVIAWAAAQPWCTGSVGMMGISWGGFNGLQVAARRPPALKAIITLCSTDDRYSDDIHFKVAASSTRSRLGRHHACLPRVRPIRCWLATAGAPCVERLEADLSSPPNGCAIPIATPIGSMARWPRFLRHRGGGPRRGGWNDAYSNAVPRLLAGLRGPVKAIIGPGPAYPRFAIPGPQIGFFRRRCAGGTSG